MAELKDSLFGKVPDSTMTISNMPMMRAQIGKAMAGGTY